MRIVLTSKVKWDALVAQPPTTHQTGLREASRLLYQVILNTNQSMKASVDLCVTAKFNITLKKPLLKFKLNADSTKAFRSCSTTSILKASKIVTPTQSTNLSLMSLLFKHKVLTTSKRPGL